MPSGVVAGYFDYPNLPPLIAGEYTCSHGITPGTITLRTHPSDISPEAFGDVTIGDGRKTFVLPNCKLIRFTAERSDAGVEWLIELEDARWKWRGGRIDGQYNQLDPHGKLIPRTIKSPTELANLCLDQMGVTRRIVDMPDGIPGNAFINNIPDFLPVGVNFPQLGLNPAVNWFADNPAQALATLAESCGRRVVYDPVEDRVLVVRPGLGEDLPNGHIHNETPALVPPETPDAVEIVGEPTRFETMFELYAVGIEWDGSIRPIDQLSYTPKIPAIQHIVKYTVTKVTVGEVYGFTVEAEGAAAGVFFRYTAAGGDTPASICALLKTALLAATDPTIAGKLAASTTTDSILIAGVQNGFLFDVILFTGDGRDAVTIKKAGAKEKRSWDFSPPPTYPNVQATDRLTRLQAVALAQRCIFKMYRLTGRDVSTLKAPIKIPGYGNAVRQDVIISEVCCDQVVPEAGDKRFVDRDGQPLIRTIYDGYSRDKPAEVYGSVCSTCFDSDTWFIGSGTANEGAAKIGGLAPAEARVCNFEVKNVLINGTSYNVTITAPGSGGRLFFYIALPGDDENAILTDLKNQINATTDGTLKGKVTASVLAGSKKMTVTGVPGFLFEMTTTTAAEMAAVTTVKTGSGSPPPPPPPTKLVSPSTAMTPPGDGKGSSLNTDPSDRVYVDFHVDPTWQAITFNSPVWFAGPGLTVQEPKLFLRCACNVKDANTQQIIAYSDIKRFRPGPSVHIAKRPDVQLNVIGDYKIGRFVSGGGAAAAIAAAIAPGGAQFVWNLKNTRLLEQDAVVRARFYLLAELLQFQLKGGLTIEYNGIEPIAMDGKTFQVTYSVVGGRGTMTTASTNMEHSTWFPPYPARRRAENLAAVARNQIGGKRVDNPGNPGSMNPGGGT